MRVASNSVPALLQSQAYVVDLTEAYDQLAALVPRRDEEKPPSVRTTEKMTCIGPR